jgi:hypothetical protein
MDYQEDTLTLSSITDSSTDTVSISLADLTQSNMSYTNNWSDSSVCSVVGGIYDANANVIIGGTGTYQYPNVAATLGSNISLSDNVYSIFGDDALRAPSGKLSLTGEQADIEINGESIVGMLKDIRDRLSILRVSEEMEAEWDDLADLRRQYEAKLAECREKSRAWAALQQVG